MIESLKSFVKDRVFHARDRNTFLGQLRPDSVILDVGCGNNSPFFAKEILPSCHYTGIDVGDYNQTKPNVADRYIVTGPEDFAGAIARFEACFDAVISSHNLEHCHERQKTLDAVLKAVKPGGRLFLAFPCEASAHFPSRDGTLNYFDDDTHRGNPPDYRGILRTLEENRFDIDFAAQRYRPAYWWLRGLLNEPRSRTQNKVMFGTWAYYGFESIIWARKKSTPDPLRR